MDQVLEQLGIKIDFYANGVVWFLIFLRVVMVVLLTPFLGTKAVPGRARMATSIVLSLFVYALIGPELAKSVPVDKLSLLPLILKEVFFGFTIALVTMMTFYALESAGRVVDSQRGGGNAQIFLPQLGQVTLFGLFNFWLAVAIFLAVGGHRHFLEAFIHSFETMPLLSLPTIAPGFSPFLEFIVFLSGQVIVIAIKLSAPVLIAILLVDLVLGLANKMAPQINVFEMGFAIKGYLAPLMIYVSIIILVEQMDAITKGMIESVTRLAKLLGT